MIKKLKSMDAYPTAHLKYVMDSEWDILQAFRTLMQKLIVTDSSTSTTTWNTPSNPQLTHKNHSDAKSKTDTGTSSNSDTQTSDDTDDSTSNKPITNKQICLLYTSPSPRDLQGSRMPSSA